MLIEEEMEPMLSLNEVANLLHIHQNTVRRWSDAGIIKAIQINQRGDRRFLKKDIELFLRNMNNGIDK